MKIAIIGRNPDTVNYVRYVEKAGHIPFVTLNTDQAADCDCVILPGGGDITPAFFGEQNRGSRNIDTELDILQLQTLDICLRKRIPTLGICKGIQIINVGLGGTLYQDMPTAARHRYEGCDQYHSTAIVEGSWLYGLYGDSAMVNSAHHQSINSLGDGLRIVQYCPEDDCIEAVAHDKLPILGVQWHPERIDNMKTMIDGEKVLAYLVSLTSLCQPAHFS